MAGLDHLWAGWRSAFVTAASAEHGAGGPSGGAATAAGTDGQPLPCVFCAILESGLPDEDAHIVWRHPRGRVFAILNAYPYTSGHLMVMPVRHVGNLEDLSADESADLWEGVTLAVKALKAAYTPDGVNLGANLGRAAGAGVPGHFHMHVVGRWSGDTNFMTTVADARVLPEALSASWSKLHAAFTEGELS